MSDKLGVTFADFSSRELPVQSALCAFDCAQVLAEWVSTVQQRVGRHMGVLGRDNIDYTTVPAIMLLEDEDCKLLEKINEVITSAEMKLADTGSMGTTPLATPNIPGTENCGFGSKILLVHARMFERAAVWPGNYHLTSLILGRQLIPSSHPRNVSVTSHTGFTHHHARNSLCSSKFYDVNTEDNDSEYTYSIRAHGVTKMTGQPSPYDTQETVYFTTSKKRQF